MTKISDIAMPLYNKFLPECETKNIALNLDLPDPTISIEDPQNLEENLKSLVESAIKRVGKNGTVTFGATKTAASELNLVIKDDGAALTREEIENMTNEDTAIRSRMGYGTAIAVKI